MNPPSQQAIIIRNETFVPFITHEEIQQRVFELAGRINHDFSEKNPIFICVLNGAFMFFADLVRHITIDCEVDFIKLSSYGEKKISSGNVTMVKDLDCDVKGRNVILVEDIVDTGHSLDFFKKWIERKEPMALHVATLLHKPAQTKIEHHLDYIGFTIPPRFVIGYGLDYGQLGRNLPAVYILPENGAQPHG